MIGIKKPRMAAGTTIRDRAVDDRHNENIFSIACSSRKKQGGGFVIPTELKKKWYLDSERREIFFLADNGGGYPDVLSGPDLNAELRLSILRGLGFRVADRFEMEGAGAGEMWPWVRLTNGVAICLRDGFVSRHGERRRRKGGVRRGREPDRQ